MGLLDLIKQNQIAQASQAGLTSLLQPQNTPFDAMFVERNPQKAGQIIATNLSNYAQSAGSPEGAMNIAMNFAPMGVLSTKGVSALDDITQKYGDIIKASGKTQIAGTLPTYQKSVSLFSKADEPLLDYGAGLGEGAKAIKANATFEPNPKAGFNPTFTNPSDIPANSFGRITNLNVLNVVPKEVRDYIVRDIARVLKPNGEAIITTRGKDVLNAKGVAGDEPMSLTTSIGTYQKGFTKKELKDYVQGLLGENFKVEPVKLGAAGVKITKLGKGSNKTQYEIAQEVAQRNAALPVSEGGLGLPANNTAMDRAKAMGFDVDIFRGENLNTNPIDINNYVLWASNNPTVANTYAGINKGAVLPLKTKSSELANIDYKGKDWESAPYPAIIENKGEKYIVPKGRYNLISDEIGKHSKNLGQKGIQFENIIDTGIERKGVDFAKLNDIEGSGYPVSSYAIFDPSLVRSRFAAFDPFRRNEADILAGLLAVPASKLMKPEEKKRKPK